MVRPAVVIACVAVALAARADAADLPRTSGMYPTSGAPLAMLDSKVEVTVRGPIVEVIVTQRFQNRGDRATEATYIFPLPVDAAVSAMSIKNGSRTIRGAIERREAAQRRYEEAVRAGVAAAVLDQERPDVFTQTVAAIPAKGIVEITLRYDTVARFQTGTWELVLPMVVAPRYVPGMATSRPTTGTGRAPDTDRAPDASRVTPAGAPGAGGSTAVAIRFADKVIDPMSPTHELRVTGNEASFSDPRSDHDAVVRWRATTTTAGWVENGPDGGYAAVVVEAAAAAPRKGPIRCMVILDRSAASRGDADAVAHPFVRGLFAAFGSADRVAVTGSDPVAWSVPADAARAIEQTWHNPAGAFDLTRVLGAARPDGAPMVLVSGGLVADDVAAIAAARKLGVPIHVIGVGPAPARGLLTQIAGATGGTVRFLVPGDDISGMAKATLADAATAPAPLTVNWGTLAASDVVPGMLPRLGVGQAMIVLARVKYTQTANVRARGELFAIETLPAPRVVDGSTTAMGPLARRWARSRLEELLAPRAPNVAAVTAHALRHGLVSPYTSLVAIGDEVVVQGGVKRSVPVPVSVPAGMKWQAVKKETTVDVVVKDSEPTVVGNTVLDGGVAVQRDHVRNIPLPVKKPVFEKDAKVKKPKTTPHRDPTSAQPPPAQAPTGNAPDDVGRYDDGDDDPAPQRKLRRRTIGADKKAVNDEEESGGEVLALSSSSRSQRGRLRITAALGGGLAVTDEQRSSLIALSTRLEVGRRTMFGIGGSLWFVSGSDAQGQLLGTFVRRGVGSRWLELGGGFGLQFGNGLGPAGSLSLRFHLPPNPRAAGYLRYDGALLLDGDTRRGQNTFTLGLEYGF